MRELDLAQNNSIADDVPLNAPAPTLSDKVRRRCTVPSALLLGAILVTAGGLRLWQLGKASFWLDEYLTVTLSSGHGFLQMELPNGEVVKSPPDYVSLERARPWYEIWPNSFGDVHPPLFYVVLRLWRLITPETDAWIRGLSVLLSLIAIVLLFDAVHTCAGRAPALWAAALMALAGLQIEYAQECRSYMLLIACLLGTGSALLRIERYGFNWLRGISVSLCALAAAMTHYLAFPILIMLGLYTIIRLRQRDRIHTVLCFAAAGVAFGALWMPWMLGQKGGFWGKIAFTKDQAWTVWAWIFWGVGLPTRFLVNSTSASPIARWLGAAWFVLPVILMLRAPKTARHLLFWWMWLTLGALAVAIGDLGRNGRMLAIPRYTLMVSPAAYALGGVMLAHLYGWRRHVLPALLCFGCIIALPGAYLRYKADWRGLDAHIANRVTKDDLIVMYDATEIPWRIRCDLIGMQYYHRSLNVPVIFLTTPPSPQAEQRIRQAKQVWFFTSYKFTRAEQVLPQARVIESFSVPQIGGIERIEWPQTPVAGRSE